jgi:adenylate cyclase
VADLIAQGNEPHQRWRRMLPVGQPIVLGREAANWSVAWDEQVSRRHAQVLFNRGVLHVERLLSARNPMFVRGESLASFDLRPGEHFVIGQTTFTLADDQVNISLEGPDPIREQTFSSQYLRRLRYRNADQRLEVLSRLPEVISGAASDSELFVRLVNMLLAGVPRAEAVALVAVEAAADPLAPVRVLQWDRRLSASGDFEPSRRLIAESLQRQQSVLHIWGAAHDAGGPTFTAHESFDWAFCTPIAGEACAGWAFYVAGRVASVLASPTPSDPSDLGEDLKFAELVASTLRSLRESQALERKNASLSQFFPPVVLSALAGGEPKRTLVPRETDVSVLFCDLRGFSRKAEQDADDLLGLLERVSKALGVMTHHILDQQGVIGDFHGDAAMGFWGWPIASADMVTRACLAALAIRTEFESTARRSGHALADFRVGIGLATGRAVAGGIGTRDQLKVTVFGPVVNLASRLEGMTRVLRAPILLDEATAGIVRGSVPRTLARLRRVAVVRPYGLDKPLEVSELLPPELEHPQLTDQHLADYEAALDAFLAGQWSDAIELLHQVPARDRVKDFLTVFIAQHNRTPPANWDRVIPLETK